MVKSKAWEISPKDLYNLICLSYDELEKDSKSISHALYLSILSYHLLEWLCKDDIFRKKLIDKLELRNNCNVFEIRKMINKKVLHYQVVRSLANGSKHMYNDKSQLEVSAMRKLPTWDKIDVNSEDLYTAWDYDGIVIKSNNKMMEILEIFKPLKHFYDDLFE